MLKDNSYFALVSGYKELLKNKDGSYKPHTTIDDIYALYEFDSDLWALVLHFVFIIECIISFRRTFSSPSAKNLIMQTRVI